MSASSMLVSAADDDKSFLSHIAMTIASERFTLDSNKPPKPERTFHLFLNLPPELRRMIYKKMMEDYNTIFELFSATYVHAIDRFGPKVDLVPSILHVSRETRAYGLERLEVKTYKFYFKHKPLWYYGEKRNESVPKLIR